MSATITRTDKSETEYRIAVLGDSFCATMTSSLDLDHSIRAYLAEDRAFKKLVKKTTVKVLNFCPTGQASCNGRMSTNTR